MDFAYYVCWGAVAPGNYPGVKPRWFTRVFKRCVADIILVAFLRIQRYGKLKEFFMNKKMINGLLFAAAAVSGAANASITSDTLLNFNKGNPPDINTPSTPGNIGMTLDSYAGKANTVPDIGGNCFGTNSEGCYYEDGLVVGIVKDSSNAIAHIHRKGVSSDRSLGYASDSSGIYIRAQDGSAFSLTSMDFKAPIVTDPNADDQNPGSGPNDFWEILGFNTALNPGLDTGNGTNYVTRVAYQQVFNGFDGPLSLNSGFSNINAFWIHYHGYPQTPTSGKEFFMKLDNVRVSAVPLPAAAWMFLSGMMGLLAFGRKKADLVA